MSRAVPVMLPAVVALRTSKPSPPAAPGLSPLAVPGHESMSSRLGRVVGLDDVVLRVQAAAEAEAGAAVLYKM